MMLARTVAPQLNRTSRSITVRNFAAVQVEHGRGEWNTYGDLSKYKPGKFQIKTLNKISPIGLRQFPADKYDVRGEDAANAHAILLRSYKLTEEDIPHTCRAIARCGAGTNNIPVARMTELGIPVFNTPGANANAVKELVICGMSVEKDKALFGGQEIAGKTLAVIGLGHIGSLTARDARGLGMNLKGYDPGLSVQSALKLPRSLTLMDSIAAAVADADYVSLNIPYIKGEGGTHGIIGKDVLSHCKPTAVVLNFARGELVDSEAMKEFLDHNDARYVTDFPDDLLWDHKNAIVVPHLGASTEEAEDSAASMAADTIRDFLETGTIVNSVNFPNTSLPDPPENSVRFSVVNKNIAGMLAHITEAFAEANLNILQQINQSRGDIAYNVMDVDTSGKEDVLSFKQVQEKITMLDGVLSSRVIYGTPGTGFARNLNGQYFV
ncbi:D-isomer specific 2-hydroxyacid dehydrogenase-like protein [Fragilaria crotonensis]|nr:D-isomer specific 2-hydroxyacid dehydrogenase-like protein [Fragilaria crotonensis]